MKKRGGLRKGFGRPRGRKPPTRVGVDESAVMTAQEVAGYLNLHYLTVIRFARQRRIPGLKLGGGDWRFLKSDLDQWIVKGGGSPSRRGAKPKTNPTPFRP